MSSLLLAQAAQVATDAAQGGQIGATAIGGSGAAEFWVFWLVAPLSLAAAVSVIVLKNPVHAALMLVVNFFTFAVFYAMLEAQFLATIQVIVYAGAIMILFLFVLMLLGVDREAEAGPGRLKGQKVAAVLLGLALFVTLTGAVAGPYMGRDSACSQTPAVQEAIADAGPDARPCAGLAAANAEEQGGNVAQIGRLLFGPYVWPFEVTSVLLVIAAIGAMVLGKRTDQRSELVDTGEADPPTRPAAATADEPAAALLEESA
jgi:NADH-quinone oxidoreductase subunit J